MLLGMVLLCALMQVAILSLAKVYGTGFRVGAGLDDLEPMPCLHLPQRLYIISGLQNLKPAATALAETDGLSTENLGKDGQIMSL